MCCHSRTSLSRLVTREKMQQSRMIHRDSAPMDYPQLPRMNNRPQIHHSTHENQLHMKHDNFHTKNLFPHDLNLDQVQTPRIISHPAPVARPHLPTPAVVAGGVDRETIEEVLAKRQPVHKVRESSKIGYYKEIANLYDESCRSILASNDIHQVAKVVGELLSQKAVGSKLHFNRYQLWCYDSTDDVYRAECSIPKKNSKMSSLTELPCDTVLETLLKLTNGRNVSVTPERDFDRVFPKLASMLLGSMWPRDESDTESDSESSSNFSDDEYQDISEKNKVGPYTDWKTIQCFELAPIDRSHDSNDSKLRVPSGFLLLGEWTTAKWVAANKKKRGTLKEIKKHVEVSLIRGPDVEAGIIEGDDKGQLTCRGFFQTELNRKLSQAIGSRFNTITLRERSEISDSRARHSLFSAAVSNALRDIDNTTAQVTDLTYRNHPKSSVETLASAVARVGVTSLDLDMSWVVLNVPPRTNDLSSIFCIFDGDTDHAPDSPNHRIRRESYPSNNSAAADIQGANVLRPTKSISQSKFLDHSLAQILEPPKSHILLNGELKPYILNISIDHMKAAGLASVEQCTKWQKENISTKGISKRNSPPSIPVLVIPFHFLSDSIIEGRSEEVDNIHHRSALLFALKVSHTDNSAGKQDFLVSKGEAIVKCFLTNMRRIQSYNESMAHSQINSLSMRLWKSLPTNKKLIQDSHLTGAVDDVGKDVVNTTKPCLMRALTRSLSSVYDPNGIGLPSKLLNQFRIGNCHILLTKKLCAALDPKLFSTCSVSNYFGAYRIEENDLSSHQCPINLELPDEDLYSPWMNNLLAGKHIFVSNISHVSQTSHGQSLVQFVRNINGAVSSFILLPIMTESGMSILYIPDVLDNGDNVDNINQHEEINSVETRRVDEILESFLYPSSTQMVDMLEASDFLGSISSILDMSCEECMQCAATVREKEEVHLLETLLHKERLSTQEVENDFLLSKYFTQWQTAVLKEKAVECSTISIQTEDVREAQISSFFPVLKGILVNDDGDQLKHHDDSATTSSSCLVSQGSVAYDDFISKTRHQLSELFPNDVIFISVKSTSSHSSSIVENSCRRSINDSSISQIVKSELNDTIFSQFIDVKRERRQVMPDISVKIIRSSIVSCSFAQWEVDALNAMCLCARVSCTKVLEGSYLYQPIPKLCDAIAQTDPPPTPKPSPPLIPFLQNTLPLLFMANSYVESQNEVLDMTKISEIIVRWVKEMCNAEVVLLRVKSTNWNVSSSESSTADTHTLTDQVRLKDMLISSEDASYSGMSSSSGLDVDDDASIDAMVKEFHHLNNNEMVLHLPGIDGELKLLGSKNTVSEDQGFNQRDREIATLASYLLSCSSIIHKKNQITSIESCHQKMRALDLEAKIDELTRQADAGNFAADKYHVELELTAGIIQLQIDILKSSSYQAISDAVFSHFNKMSDIPWRNNMKIKSATLLLKSDNGIFSFVKPTSYDSMTKKSNLQTFRERKIRDSDADVSLSVIDFNEEFTLADLKMLPEVGSYPSSSAGIDKRVMFLAKSATEDTSSDVYGAILFGYEVTSPARRIDYPSDNIFELDIFLEMVSHTISSVTTSIELSVVTGECSTKQIEINHIYAVNEKLSTDIDKAQENISLLTEDLRNLKMDRDKKMAMLKADNEAAVLARDEKDNVIEELKESHEISLNKYEDQVQLLRRDLDDKVKQCESASQCIDDFEKLIVGFAADPRFESRQVLTWMQEAADSSGVSVEMIRQDTGGNLVLWDNTHDTSGLSSNLQRGVVVNPSVIFSIAKETIRDAKAVELATVLDRNRTSSGNRTNSTHAVVLCIPNRLGYALRASTRDSSQNSANGDDFDGELSSDINENLCYAFIRLGDKTFSEYEKAYFNCIVSILSKSSAIAEYNKKMFAEKYKTLYSNSKYPITTIEMEKMLSNVQVEKARIKRLNDTMIYSTSAWSSTCRSWTEFFPIAEAGVRHVLSELSRDPCDCNSTVEAFAWSPNRVLASKHTFGYGTGKLTSSGLDTMNSVAHRVYTNGIPMRSGNYMWVPLKVHSGDTVCVLCCEKKFDLHKAQSSESSIFSDENRDGNYSSSQRTESDVFSKNATNKLLFSTIDEEAMSIFCTLGTGAVDRLVNHKETLVSVQQASKAIVVLQEKQSDMESKMALELSRKLKLEEALQFGCDVLSAVIRKRMEFPTLIDNLRRALKTVSASFECLILTSFSQDEGETLETIPPNSPENNLNVLKKKYYFFDEINGKTKVVYLSPMDIEFVAMETQRNFKANSHSGVHDQSSTVGISGAINEQLVMRINSWAIRHVSEDDTMDQCIYALAVPCAFKLNTCNEMDKKSVDGCSPSAVVIVLRNQIEYDKGDEICVSYLSKVFSWCSDILLNPEFGGSGRIIEELRNEQVLLQRQIREHERIEVERDARDIEEKRVREREREMERDREAARNSERQLESERERQREKDREQERENVRIQRATEESKVNKKEEVEMDTHTEKITGLQQLLTDLLELPEGGKKSLDGTNLVVDWLEKVYLSIDTTPTASSRHLGTTGEEDSDKLSPCPSLNCLDIVVTCAKSAFGCARLLDVSTSSEKTHDFNGQKAEKQHDAFFMMDVDNNIVRSKKDSFFMGPLKLIFWEETESVVDYFESNTTALSRKAPAPSSTCLKSVVCFPEFHEYPIWLTFKKDRDELPDAYKIKLLFMLKLIWSRQVEFAKVQEIMQCFHSRQNTLLREFSTTTNEMQKSFDECKKLEEKKYDNFLKKISDKKQKHIVNMEALKQKCKELARECIEEKNAYQLYSNKIAAAAQQIFTINEGIDKKKKKFHTQRLLRKLSELMAPTQDVSAACVVDDAVKSPPSHKSALHSHLSLSWVAGTTQWIGNNANNIGVAPKSVRIDGNNTATNPILIAQSSNRVVVVVSTDDNVKKLREIKVSSSPDVLESPNTTDIFPVLEEGIDFTYVVSNLFPELTVVIPVKFSLRREEIIFVVKPPPSPQNPDVLTEFSVVLPVVISSWLFLRSCLVSRIKTHDLEVLQETANQSNVVRLLTLILKKQLSRLHIQQKGKAFSRFKYNLFKSRESQFRRKHSEAKGELSRMHEHIRELEQSVADWTELVKGVNGASGSIDRGLPGLWGEASRPLMQLINSHVILDGCGLMVATPDGEVLDLSVMELSPPDYDKSLLNKSYHDFRATDLNDDMAPADINIRPASELGTNVQSLAWSILSTMGGVTSNVQRLWKLTKNRNLLNPGQNQFEEQMWLVPVRTSSEVLGVLRVAVRVPVIPEGTVTNSSFSHSKTVHFNSKRNINHHESFVKEEGVQADDFDSYSEEDSVMYTSNLLTSPSDRANRSSIKKSNSDFTSIESAKRNLINFSEVMAPLVTAARQLDSTKTQEQEFKEIITDLEKNQTAAQEDLHNHIRQIRLLTSCMSKVGQVARENLRDEDLNLDSLELLRRRLKAPLESILDDVNIDFVSSLDPEKGNLARLESQDYVTMEEPIIVLNAEGSRVLSSIQNVYLQATFRQHDDSHIGDTFVDHLTAGARPDVMLKILLPPLAIIVSGFYSAMIREIDAKQKVSTAVENLHALKHQIDDVVVLKNDMSYKEIIAAETSEFNRKLVDVMEAFVLCAVDEPQKSIARAGSISSAAESLLHDLSSKFAGMFKGNECVFNFALLSNPLKEFDENYSSEVDHDNDSTRSLVWYYGHTGHQSLKYKITDDILQISTNLATSCISKGVKSCIDVDIDSGEREVHTDDGVDFPVEMLSPNKKGIKILTVPIFSPINPSNSSVIGVIQVFSSTTAEDKVEINDFTDSISQTIGVVLGHDMRRQASTRRSEEVTAANLVLQNSINELSTECDLLQRQSQAWNSVMSCIKYTLMNWEMQDREASILKCILANSEQLKTLGIVVQGAQVKNKMKKGEVIEGYEEVCTRIFHHVANKSDVIMRLFIDKKKFFTDLIDKKAFVSMFECLNDVFGCLDALAHAKYNALCDVQSTITKLSKKNEKLRLDRETVANKLIETVGECNLLAQKISTSEQESSSLIQARKDWEHQLTRAVGGVVNALGADVTNLLKAMPNGEKELSTSLNFPVETTELLFSRFAHVVSEALDHVAAATDDSSGNGTRCHVSVLVTSRKALSSKTAEDKLKKSATEDSDQYFDGNMVMFDGNASRGVPIRNTSDPKARRSSAISKCFRSGVMQVARRGHGEQGYQGDNSNLLVDSACDLLSGDLEGVDSLLTVSKSVCMLVVPLNTCVADLLSVVRIVFEDQKSCVDAPAADSDASKSSAPILLSQHYTVLRAVAEMISSLGLPVSRLYHHHGELQRLEVSALRENKRHEESLKGIEGQLTKYKKLHKLVCRESSTLMDPPTSALISHAEMNPITNHPASLPPLVALQDTSVKALSMIRTLLKSEGQALLLRNPNTNPQSYQIIYTGNALSWRGIEQGTFGLVSGTRKASMGEASDAKSLVEAVMASHKSIELSDAHTDPRYNPAVDGFCVKKTPMLVVPVRGRSGGVVGVLMATREQNSPPFSGEDVIACDLVSAFSSISLYWGQGLGYIHEKLTKSMTKMESLEQSVSALKKR